MLKETTCLEITSPISRPYVSVIVDRFGSPRNPNPRWSVIPLQTSSPWSFARFSTLEVYFWPRLPALPCLA